MDWAYRGRLPCVYNIKTRPDKSIEVQNTMLSFFFENHSEVLIVSGLKEVPDNIFNSTSVVAGSRVITL